MGSNIIPRISVIIITYNQEDLISRALDSVLTQKKWLYEIIVCDDCSNDNNWNVITKYKEDYPELIKTYRNNKNLGIFGNYESTWTKPNGDLITYLSGDDKLCNGLLKEVHNFIKHNNIDYEKDQICLYSDFITIWPNKVSYVYRNSMINKNFNPISLKLRGLISNRTTIFSSNLLKNFYSVRKDIGIYADGLLDIQIQLFAKKNYYIPFTGSIYYAGIGISEKVSKELHLKSMDLFYDELKKIYSWSNKDLEYIKYRKEILQIYLNKKPIRFLKIIYFFIRGIDFQYGIAGFNVKETLFKLNRRILELVNVS
jgi:glycosyltransferase involved in cell wall biosynthesis